MLALSHVVLHIGFCNAIAQASPTTTVALHVRLTDRRGTPQVDRVFRVTRGDEGEGIVEFDSAFGIYSLVVDAPKYRCAASDYLYFIAGHDRSITEKLADGGAPPARPILVSGSAPQSFLYVAPTFVVFDKKSDRLQQADTGGDSDGSERRERSRCVLRVALTRPVGRTELAAACAAIAHADAPVPLRAAPGAVPGALGGLADEHHDRRDGRHGRFARQRSGGYASLSEDVAHVRRIT